MYSSAELWSHDCDAARQGLKKVRERRIGRQDQRFAATNAAQMTPGAQHKMAGEQLARMSYSAAGNENGVLEKHKCKHLFNIVILHISLHVGLISKSFFAAGIPL